MDRRVAYAVLAVVAVVVLFFVFRPESEETSEPLAQTARTATTPQAEPATTTQEERPKVSEIAVRDGKPVGGPLDARVVKGDLVELRVFADVTDEVHLHGYDLKAAATPQKPARLRFRATLTGRFEVELENSHVPVGRLTVSP